MPDHLHAFIALDDQKIALAARMKSSKKYALEDVAPQWNCGTALAKDFFDHVLRKRGVVGGELALCAGESGPRWTGQELGGLAISRRNL